MVQAMLSPTASHRPSAAELEKWAPDVERHSSDSAATGPAPATLAQQKWTQWQQVDSNAGASATGLDRLLKGRTASNGGSAKDAKRRPVESKAARKLGSGKQATLAMTRIFDATDNAL